MAYRAADDHSRALPYFEKALELRRKILKNEHPYTINSMINVASCYKSMNRMEDSQEMNDRALALAQKVLGDDHNTTLTLMQNIAVNHWNDKKLELSIPLFEQVLAGKQSKNGREHSDTLQAMANLGANYRDAKRFEEALPLLQESYDASENNPKLDFIGPALLEAHLLAGKAEDASKHLTKLLDSIRASTPANSMPLADKLTAIGDVLMRSDAFTDAETIFRECNAIRSVLEPDHWKTFNTMASLGKSLLQQKKLEEAETWLLKGFDGVSQSSETQTKQQKESVIDIVNSIIDNYTFQNKDAETTRWTDVRSKLLTQ